MWAYLSYYSGRSILTPTDGQLLCSGGKESTCNAGDLGLIPGSERNFSIRKLPGESHRQRSLTSYSPWGCKESDNSATNPFIYFLLLFCLIPFFSTFLRTSPFQFPSHLIFLGSFLSAISTLRNTKPNSLDPTVCLIFDSNSPNRNCLHFLSLFFHLPHFTEASIPTTPLKTLWWLSGKESTCQCKRLEFDPWVRKIPWRRKWQLISVFLSAKSHG